MAVESRSLLERISARIGEPKPGTRNRTVRDVLSPDYEGDDSPRPPPCSQQLELSDSEGEKHSLQFGCQQKTLKFSVWRREPDSSIKNKHFSFPEEKSRSSVRMSDSSDEEFENFLIQLKTPKQPKTKTLDKQSQRIKSFIVDSEDDFDSMFSKSGKGAESRTGMKTSVLVSSRSSQKAAGSSQWNDSPVFISDSDEDSIVISSTWSDRHRTNRNPKDKGQRSNSVPKKVQENHLEPPNLKSSGGPERPLRTEPAPCTPVSSDDEFECLMDRIKNRTKNQTPRSTASKGNPKIFLAEPLKAPCLDLTNKKVDTKPRPPARSDPLSPGPPSEKKHLDDVETSHPGNTGVPCRVAECFLNNLSHPTSVYVKEFRQKKQELASRLFSLYNRTVFDEKLPNNLEIVWNKKMRKTAGYCVTGQTKLPNVQRYARIELSEKVCDSADRLRDTLIHEICHAATWLINGVRDGHGQYWRFYALKATIVHPELPMVTRCHTYEINYKFTYQCSRCQNTIGRHSKSLDTERFVCALCKGNLVLQAATRKDGSPATTQLTPFAKFVKENYGSAKKEMSGRSHAEVMRKLSANFSTKTKISD